MRRAAPTLALLASALVAGGCAHAPGTPGSSGPSAPLVEWPAPPAPPRVRLLHVVAGGGERHRSFWRAALSWLAGTDEGAKDDTGFARPFDVAFDGDGSFLIADPDRPSVRRYGTDGRELASLDCREQPWSAPMGIAVASDGSAWVADGGAEAIVRWTPRGCTIIRTGEETRPTGIALGAGRVYVTDAAGHRVLAFSLAGSLEGRFGERGTGDGQFNFPTDVAVAPDGTLFVVDALNFRVAHLSSDGRWLGAFGSAGERGGELARPKGIHVDAGGAIYVSDAQRDQVLVFRKDGAFDYAIGATGEAPGWFAHPAGIDERSGLLLVADSQNRRIQLFQILGERT